MVTRNDSAVRLVGMMYGMKERKLTIRVSEEVLEGAKRYAQDHGTTLSRLVTAYLQKLGAESDPLRSAPITRSLAGALPVTASRAEWRVHLDEKYDGAGE
jgi:hypothetical protein